MYKNKNKNKENDDRNAIKAGIVQERRKSLSAPGPGVSPVFANSPLHSARAKVETQRRGSPDNNSDTTSVASDLSEDLKVEPLEIQAKENASETARKPSAISYLGRFFSCYSFKSEVAKSAALSSSV